MTDHRGVEGPLPKVGKNGEVNESFWILLGDSCNIGKGAIERVFSLLSIALKLRFIHAKTSFFSIVH